MGATSGGRVVLVTGAASGNGLAIATRFLERGDRVAAVDLNADALSKALGAQWSAYEQDVHCITSDVADADSVDAMFATVEQTLGEVDVLVNNAGITGGADATTLAETPVGDFDRVWQVNVRAVYLASKRALATMVPKGTGNIVNIASVAGLVAFPGRSAYSISKAAVVGLTRSIAADYAARGIRCNALCPGMIETPMTQWRLDQPDLREQLLSRIPQREIGTVGDVAEGVLFLASPEARYFNGAALAMDGGYHVV